MRILRDGTNVSLTGSAQPDLADQIYGMTVVQVLDAVDAGQIDAAAAVTAEIAGKARGSLLQALHARSQ